MNNKTALLVAIALGVLSVLGIHFYIQKIQQQVQQGQELVEVLVSSASLNAGQKITQDHIRKQQVPLRFVQGLRSTEIKNPNLLLSATLRLDIAAGQIFQTYHVNEVAADVKKLEVPSGFRAITVPVSVTTGVGGMLQPGDFVDCVATIKDKKTRIGGVKVPEYSGVILQHLLVIAVDQRTSKESKDFRFGYKTVTLRATPDEAVQIAHVVTLSGGIYMIKSLPNVQKSPNTNATSTALLVESLQSELSKKLSRLRGNR